MARRAAWLVLLTSLAVFASSGASLVVDSARADEPLPVPYKAPEAVYTEPTIDPEPADCPQVPEALVDGEAVDEQYSDELEELRFQRIATARMCEALADRSDLVSQRLWWAVLELAEGRGQRVVTNAKLSQLLEEECSAPCPVTVAAGEGQTSELVSSIDSSGEASRLGLWVLIGVVVAGTLAYGIWRTTMPKS